MEWMIPTAMFGWPLLCLLISGRFERESSIAFLLVLGWLFLPEYEYELPGFPDYTRTTALGLGAIMSCMMHDPKTLFRVRWSRWDLPMLIWCLSPIFSSLSNDLGLRDGISGALTTALTWFLPYWVGRAYLGSEKGLRSICWAILIGALIYVPLILIEIRLSPQLHRWIYGFHQHSFQQTMRFGGYRPMVFLGHGLILALWMAAATIVSAWLWRTQRTLRIGGWPIGSVFVFLLCITIACRSVNAVGLMLLTFPVIFLPTAWWRRLCLVGLLMLGPTYTVMRLSVDVPVQSIAAVAGQIVSKERGASLLTRFENEDMLMEKAFKRPLLGWGAWGRSRIYDDWGKDISITDSRWIIVFGQRGLLGIAMMLLVFLAPILRFLRQNPLDIWNTPKFAYSAAFVCVCALVMINDTVNYADLPIIFAGLGAIGNLRLSIKSNDTPRPIQAAARPRFI